MSATYFDKRRVIGRRIVGVDLNGFPDGKGGLAHAPVLRLDNGAELHFVVEETEVGEYGVVPVVRRARRKVPA